jgi:hypothetical protein
MPTTDAPPPSPPTSRLLLVVGGVLFLVLYDEQLARYVFHHAQHANTWAQLTVLLVDVALVLALTRGRTRELGGFVAAIVVLDVLAFVPALDRWGIELGLSLAWMPLLYLLVRRLAFTGPGDAQLLLPIFAGATLVYVVSALYGPVIDDVEQGFFAQASALIPVLVVGLILERGLSVRGLDAARHKALLGYALVVLVLGEVAALCALIPHPDRLRGTWGQYTLFALTVNGVGVALATLVLVGAGTWATWDPATHD